MDPVCDAQGNSATPTSSVFPSSKLEFVGTVEF